MIKSNIASQHSPQTFWLTFFSAGIAMVAGVSIQYDITILILMVGFVTLSLLMILKQLLIFLNSSDTDWVLGSAELVVPSVLWVLFGLGGVISFFLPEVVKAFGTTYEMATVLLTALYVSIGALCYLGGFRWIFGHTPLQSYGRTAISQKGFRYFLGLLLAFDWYVRFDQIRGGIYFEWLTNYSDTTQAALRTTNTLYQFHNTISPIVLPLLMYAIVVFSKKWSYGTILIAQATLVSLQGQRRDVVLVAFMILLSYFAIRRFQPNRKIVLISSISALAFFSYIGPAMQDARLMMRYDARTLVASPDRILGRYVFEYLPQTLSLGGRWESYLSNLDSQLDKNSSLAFRTGAYMSYAASIHQSMIDGRVGPNLDHLGTAVSLIIPRIFFPNKQSVDANDLVYAHFGFGRLGDDATGSPVADIFSYLHLPGIIVLFLIIGGGFGFVARHLRHNYGQFGDMIMLGFLPSALPTGDAFGAYLAGLRNVFIFLVLMASFMKWYSLFFRQHPNSSVEQTTKSSELPSRTARKHSLFHSSEGD